MQRELPTVVIVGGTASGKTRLLQSLRLNGYNVCRVLTTRDPRGDPEDDCNYTFTTKKTFRKQASAGALLFEDFLFGYHYGIPRQEVQTSNLYVAPAWRGNLLMECVGPGVGVHLLSPQPSVLRRRLLARSTRPVEIHARIADAARQNQTVVSGFHRVHPQPIASTHAQVRTLIKEQMNSVAHGQDHND